MYCICQQKQSDILSFLKRLYLQHLYQQRVCRLRVHLSENGSQSTSSDLLLDAWWLEFWELILLAAGDIERNPGPITGSQTSLIPDLIRVIYYCCVGEQLAKVDNRVLGKEYLNTVVNVTSYTYMC